VSCTKSTKAAFGRWDYHLHELQIGGENVNFVDVYDFGDDWHHLVGVEQYLVGHVVHEDCQRKRLIQSVRDRGADIAQGLLPRSRPVTREPTDQLQVNGPGCWVRRAC
jgi:hypothetical protein